MFNLELKEQFSGPLDLLLTLIDDRELNISELAISEVTEQYLNYLDTLDEKQAGEIADFLVVAARLLLLKSKTLLPQLMPDEDEGQSLADQLRIYQRFVKASGVLNQLWNQDIKSYGRIEPAHKIDEVILPKNAGMESLHETMIKLIRRLKPPKPLPETKIDKAVSLRERIDIIRKLLFNKRTVSFSELLQDSNNRTEVIVSFLAILELLKNRTVSLKQENPFNDIVIEKI